MSLDAYAFIGVALGAVVALYTGMRSTAAQQISSLGGRMDKTAADLKDCQATVRALDRRNRALWEYVTKIRLDYISRGVEPPPLPDELEGP